MVLVRLHANAAVGKYFARMGHVPLRRCKSNFQSRPGIVKG